MSSVCLFFILTELVDRFLVQQDGDPNSPVHIHDFIVDYIKRKIPKQKQVNGAHIAKLIM